MQAVAIHTADGAPSCKRKDVLSMRVDQIRAGWAPILEGLTRALYLLRDDCGVVLPAWLPYNTILVPMAAVMARVSTLKGPKSSAAQQQVRKWFWCSVFGQTYEKAPNSQSVRDYGELIEWIDGGSPPQAVRNFSFDRSMLRQTTPRQRAIYRGVIALVLRNGATDFHTDARITASIIRDKKIDDHHVFPQAYLEEHRPDVTHLLRDCVLNRTLIDKETNIRISRRAPSDYLTEIRTTIGPSTSTISSPRTFCREVRRPGYYRTSSRIFWISVKRW